MKYIGILVIIVALGFIVNHLSKRNRQTVSPPPDATSRNVEFIASDGYRLDGTLSLPKKNGKAPVIIVVHQFNSTRHDFDRFLPVLLGEGYGVLAYDTRGFGNSQHGQTNLNDFPKDIEGAVSFLRNQSEVDSERIGLIGASVGANEAFVASGTIEAVKTAVALSPAASDNRAALMGQGIADFSPHNLLIASDEAEQSEAEVVFALTKAPKEQKVYPGFGHGVHLLAAQQAQVDVLKFLAATLKPNSTH